MSSGEHHGDLEMLAALCGFVLDESAQQLRKMLNPFLYYGGQISPDSGHNLDGRQLHPDIVWRKLRGC
jgi:hypothetical protein